MYYIGDLHIHSRYSRATSKDCTPEHLDLWARRKGIHIVGTGDFYPSGVAGGTEREAGAGGRRALCAERRIQD